MIHTLNPKSDTKDSRERVNS